MNWHSVSELMRAIIHWFESPSHYPGWIYARVVQMLNIAYRNPEKILYLLSVMTIFLLYGE